MIGAVQPQSATNGTFNWQRVAKKAQTEVTYAVKLGGKISGIFKHFNALVVQVAQRIIAAQFLTNIQWIKQCVTNVEFASRMYVTKVAAGVAAAFTFAAIPLTLYSLVDRVRALIGLAKAPDAELITDQVFGTISDLLSLSDVVSTVASLLKTFGWVAAEAVAWATPLGSAIGIGAGTCQLVTNTIQAVQAHRIGNVFKKYIKENDFDGAKALFAENGYLARKSSKYLGKDAAWIHGKLDKIDAIAKEQIANRERLNISLDNFHDKRVDALKILKWRVAVTKWSSAFFGNSIAIATIAGAILLLTPAAPVAPIVFIATALGVIAKMIFDRCINAHFEKRLKALCSI